jgi:hypothetical protein
MEHKKSYLLLDEDIDFGVMSEEEVTRIIR